MNDSDLVRSVLSKNRAEELGYDVWQHYVIPPFFKRLDLHTARKPNLIIGGRGCGKTMLLRYLSHQSMFSRFRPSIPESAFLNIGLYWRADTQFASAMIKREVPEDTWRAAFKHMLALVLGMEVLSSLESIATNDSPLMTRKEVMDCNFERLKAFAPDLPSSANKLRDDLERRLWEFESWVNDVRKAKEPSFLPGDKFVLALIKEVRSQLKIFSNTTYQVYIDEYENLCVYQQEIINTWLKHSESPLIFNVAMKRHAFETRGTTGDEALSDIHDFRVHDLEEYFLDEKFEPFAAEILFLPFENAGLKNTPISVETLHDPEGLAQRRTSTYIKKVIGAAEKLLPDVSSDELAEIVFADKALLQKLRDKIQSGLTHKQSNLKVQKFIKEQYPSASIVIPALLHRKSENPTEILSQLDSLERSEDNRFTGKTNWIHNNFVGCLLQLYEPHSRACPFYAGFHTFCQLSRGNIRHFLELCHKSLNRAMSAGESSFDSVPFTYQAEAARQASAAFLGEIRSFGRHGNQLHTFVLRLGSLFALAHQRPTQSESEQSHFSIGSGTTGLTTTDQEFLNEAVKWSVLFENKGTKIKSKFEPENIEYVLNPIYAPYFHISYRKKRKLELSTDDAQCLIRGSYDDVSHLLRRYAYAWAVEPADLSPTLFSHLESGV